MVGSKMQSFGRCSRFVFDSSPPSPLMAAAATEQPTNRNPGGNQGRGAGPKAGETPAKARNQPEINQKLNFWRSTAPGPIG